MAPLSPRGLVGGAFRLVVVYSLFVALYWISIHDGKRLSVREEKEATETLARRANEGHSARRHLEAFEVEIGKLAGELDKLAAILPHQLDFDAKVATLIRLAGQQDLEVLETFVGEPESNDFYERTLVTLWVADPSSSQLSAFAQSIQDRELIQSVVGFSLDFVAAPPEAQIVIAFGTYPTAGD